MRGRDGTLDGGETSVKGFGGRRGVEGDRNEHVLESTPEESSRRSMVSASVEPFSLGDCSATTFR